jgi:DsbC/DsbD-like thiol-disulfide interchange protein
MTIVSRVVAAALLGLAAPSGMALAEEASGWADGFHSRARLVSGGSLGAEHWAGVEIVLDRGYKTYWREPGDSGLPPRFDWTASTNAATIDLRWPAPTRTEDAAGVTHTYSQRVVFPVRVQPADPSKPVALQLTMEYGVCKEICIPAQASLALTLGTGEGALRPTVEQALARVPRPQAVAAEGPLSITAIDRRAGDKPTYLVEARSPEGAVLFAEGPESWYLSTSVAQPGNRFTVMVDERPQGAAGPVRLRLTLVAGDDAVETEIDLDEGLAPR